jgi:hypothetical protein
MNVWNLKNSKSRLDIIEKTSAQRRHLMGLLSVKTQIDTNKVARLKHNISPNNIPAHMASLLKDNAGIAKRLRKISRSISSSQTSHNSLNLSTVSRNLKTCSSLTRNIRMKEIDK